MATTRAQIRAHIGAALPFGYYVSSRTTAASSTNNEIIDAKRTEHDDFWRGATIRINSQDVPVRGGTGANTGRTPAILLDQSLTGAAGISTSYELLKGPTFTDIDEALADTWPYFFDAVDDTTTVALIADTVEYALPATWREVVRVEQQQYNTTPTRYGSLVPGQSFDVLEDAANPTLLLRFIPNGSLVGLKLRIFARAIPSMGSGDASTTVHPYSVIVPGALAYLYRRGMGADEGTLSSHWAKKAEEQRGLFEERKRRFALTRRTHDTRFPIVTVSGY